MCQNYRYKCIPVHKFELDFLGGLDQFAFIEDWMIRETHVETRLIASLQQPNITSGFPIIISPPPH